MSSNAVPPSEVIPSWSSLACSSWAVASRSEASDWIQDVAMLCADPFVKAGEAFPCGKCLPCRKRRMEVWRHRIMLESLLHSASAFVTLTYADDHLPTDMSLRPVEFTLWMKRLREELRQKDGSKLRFYACGEYGGRRERPHYHAILFGYQSCLRGRSCYSEERTACCSQCDRIRDSWGKGHVYLGKVEYNSAGYVCEYIIKNMRHRHDVRLRGREPEFARMSRMPGLGFGALDAITQEYLRYELDEGEAPTGVRHGGVIRPYGRYLRTKLADMLDMNRDGRDEEMQALWDVAASTAPPGEVRRLVFKNLLIDAGEQRIRNMEARLELKRSKRNG